MTTCRAPLFRGVLQDFFSGIPNFFSLERDMIYRICFLITGVVKPNLFSISKFFLDKVDFVCYGPKLFVYKPNLFSGRLILGLG